MSSGYIITPKDTDTDIQVLTEDDSNVVTYSLASPFTATRLCRNECPYCSFRRRDTLVVPYSTIKSAKHARQLGAREGVYVSGERPDKYNNVRSLLDLWGFSSYLDYLYTVCELGFLEGLIPSLEVGFLSPVEMKKMLEVCAINKIMLDSIDPNQAEKFYEKSPGKKLELRVKSLHWAGKLKFPTTTGIIIGMGESKSHRKEMLHTIADIHKEYGTIHEVILQNFVPQSGLHQAKGPASKADMLSAVENALNILPEDVSVTVPLHLNLPWIDDILRAGVRDLGRVYTPENPSYCAPHPPVVYNIDEIAESMGLRLQQRFTLKKSFIKNGMYSKKLGQIFDAYRYKIKKESSEKTKEVRVAS